MYQIFLTFLSTGVGCTAHYCSRLQLDKCWTKWTLVPGAKIVVDLDLITKEDTLFTGAIQLTKMYSTQNAY